MRGVELSAFLDIQSLVHFSDFMLDRTSNAVSCLLAQIRGSAKDKDLSYRKTWPDSQVFSGG